VSEYEYVFMPDDDLECDADSINVFFDLCRAFNLVLAQPSLTIDSFVSHAITLHNPDCIIRTTNYVEIMAPCFHHSALERCMPTFGENLSGWGLCILWPHLLADCPTQIGIVDAVQFKHTRPVYGPNYDHLRTSGVEPVEELEALLRKYSLNRPILKNTAVVDLQGCRHELRDYPDCPAKWLTVPFGKII